MQQLKTNQLSELQTNEETSTINPSSPEWKKFLRMLNGKGAKITPPTAGIKSKQRAKAKAARKARRKNR